MCRRFDPAPDHFRRIPPIVAKCVHRQHLRTIGVVVSWGGRFRLVSPRFMPRFAVLLPPHMPPLTIGPPSVPVARWACRSVPEGCRSGRASRAPVRSCSRAWEYRPIVRTGVECRASSWAVLTLARRPRCPRCTCAAGRGSRQPGRPRPRTAGSPIPSRRCRSASVCGFPDPCRPGRRQVPLKHLGRVVGQLGTTARPEGVRPTSPAATRPDRAGSVARPAGVAWSRPLPPSPWAGRPAGRRMPASASAVRSTRNPVPRATR